MGNGLCNYESTEDTLGQELRTPFSALNYNTHQSFTPDALPAALPAAILLFI